MALATGFVAWYFSARSASVTNNPSIRTSSPKPASTVSGQGASQTAIPDVIARPKTVDKAPAASEAWPADERRENPGPPPPKPASAEEKVSKAGAEKQIKGWITEADSDYNDGLYEDAIKLYEKALKADPGNRQLQTKLQRARKAKTTEESLH